MHNLKRLEVHGIKVLTTRQLAEAYWAEKDNKDGMGEEIHYCRRDCGNRSNP